MKHLQEHVHNVTAFTRPAVASALFGLLFSVLASTAAWAQSTAQVNGRVTDQTGAVLPGVEITVTQTNTGLTRTSVTNETGSYILTTLPVGPYRLEGSLPGFRTYVQTGIVLQVNSSPVVNVVLQVGQVAETVEVQADAALVETRTTGVGQVIDNVRILELPLNGRETAELILLSGAAVSTGIEDSGRSQLAVRVSIAGAQENGVEFRLDGSTNNDPTTNFNLPMPFPEALQEFKVETSAIPAQYGHHAGGVVNSVTKSGTNQFHGSLFEFHRTGSLNARNAFALKRDSLKRNQFGGAFGGPIAQNKLFFFVGHQSTVVRSAPTDQFSYIPTQQMVQGDFTAAASPTCNSGRPVTLRPPFVNNRIDPSLLSRAALNLVKILPTTTDPCGLIRYGLKADDNQHQTLGRMDYQQTNKHSMFFRYMFTRRDQPSTFDGDNLLTTVGALDRKQRAQTATLGSTYLIGTDTISSFRAAFGRTLVNQLLPASWGDKFNVTWADLGVKNYYLDPAFPKYFYLITQTFNTAGGNPSNQNATMFQFSEDLSMVRRAHQIQFGAEYINTRMNTQGNTNTIGKFTFGSSNTGLALGDLLTGQPASWAQGIGSTWYQRQNSIATYLQDTWRMSSRLTVNGGIRWEPFLPHWEKRSKTVLFDESAFDQGIKSTVYKNSPAGLKFPGDSGFPETKKSSDNHWMNFAPRIGLAWDPTGSGQMTVRASYGILFDFPHFYQFSGIKESPPWGGNIQIQSPIGGFDDPWRGYPGGNPFPLSLSHDMDFPLSAVYVIIPRKIKAPYVNQWGLTIQRQIGTNWVGSASYLGNLLVHQWASSEMNPGIYIPGNSSRANLTQRRRLYLKNPKEGQYYSYLPTVNDGGTRSFNGMLLSIQRRASRGLTILANYTLSHCIDDGATDQFANNGLQIPERRGANRGDCTTDRRHNFNLSSVYETPRFSNATLRGLASGWQVSPIVRVLSGAPLTVGAGSADAAMSGTSDQRANQVLSDPYALSKSVNLWLNPAAFALPAIGTYGNSSRRAAQGPGSIQIDMGLTRRFQVREEQSLEFRAEAFNLPNHMNPGNPIVDLTNGQFGRIQSARDARIIQLALKYVF